MQDRTDVKNVINTDEIARLAKLSFTESETKALEKDLRDFTEYVRILEEYCSHIQNTENQDCAEHMRPDTAVDSEMKISHLPTADADGYIKVPLTVGGAQ